MVGFNIGSVVYGFPYFRNAIHTIIKERGSVLIGVNTMRHFITLGTLDGLSVSHCNLIIHISLPC